MKKETNFSKLFGANVSENAHKPIDRARDRIILYSSNRAGLDQFSEVLRRHGTKFTATSDSKEAKALVNSKEYDAIMIDVTGLDEQGLDMMKWARSNGGANIKVFGFTRTDFAPIRVVRYYIGADNTFCYSREEVLELSRVFYQIMIHQPQLKWSQTLFARQNEIARRIQNGKNNDAPILLTGPEGTGKIAYSVVVHALSKRKDGNFIVADCTPRHQFNYVDGFFRDTQKNRKMLNHAYKRLLGQAYGGTIVFRAFTRLNQIAKEELLKALKARQCWRPEKNSSCTYKGRIILMTGLDITNDLPQVDQDLIALCGDNVLKMAPLSDFKDEIPDLAQEIIEQDCFRMNAPKSPQFTQPAVEKLQNYDWPGNLDELYDVVSEAMNMHNGGKISDTSVIFRDLADHRPKYEKDRLLELLIEHRWNKTQVGKALNTSRQSISRRIKEYNLPTSLQEYLTDISKYHQDMVTNSK